MRKFCLIGGLGPESTVEYYKLIISKYKKMYGTECNPEFMVNSLNITKLLSLVDKCEYDELTDYLFKAINQGYKSGADYAAIGANTPHIVFDKLNEITPIPLISIIESTAKYASNNKIEKVALLGTKFTMKEDFFKNVLVKHDVTPFVPNDDEQEFIHSRIRSELEYGIINEDTKIKLLSIINRMIKEDGVEGVILGCTELPLILSQDDDKRILFINTIDRHVTDIVTGMK